MWKVYYHYPSWRCKKFSAQTVSKWWPCWRLMSIRQLASKRSQLSFSRREPSFRSSSARPSLMNLICAWTNLWSRYRRRVQWALAAILTTISTLQCPKSSHHPFNSKELTHLAECNSNCWSRRQLNLQHPWSIRYINMQYLYRWRGTTQIQLR